ncbi:MAG: HutD family protein [Bacillota bacterium]|nr:HutD family protein [Bacillota bacterium]
MEKILYKQENYKTGQWSGGTTRQMAIYPENADYIKRDFIWRLSSADSNLEESSFTKLPDFDRILMVLEGSVVLAHGEERTVELGPLQQDAFDGAIKTKCFGNLKRDYNLIMRKGSKGRMELIEVTGEGRRVTLTERLGTDGDGLGGECASLGIYCLDGYTVVSIDGTTEMVREDQQLVINCKLGEMPELTVMGSGKCIFTEVIFTRLESFVSETSTDAKASKGDFSTALKLSLGNNKWNKVMKRASRKGDLYDPILEKKLRFLDKFMITFIIWAVGVTLCACTLFLGLSTGGVFALIVAFTALHLFVIRPLVYMAILPKPISAHIKSHTELNEYEKKLYDEQLDYDPHQEKLMHKYRDRSGEEYSSRRDFISRLNK